MYNPPYNGGTWDGGADGGYMGGGGGYGGVWQPSANVYAAGCGCGGGVPVMGGGVGSTGAGSFCNGAAAGTDNNNYNGAMTGYTANNCYGGQGGCAGAGYGGCYASQGACGGCFRGCNGECAAGYGGEDAGYSYSGGYEGAVWNADDEEYHFPKYSQGHGPMYSEEVLGTRIDGGVAVNITGKQGAGVPEPMSTFELCDAVFPPIIMAQMRAAGFTQPMPIQANTWAIAIQGRDIIGVAKTGSGKTLAFLLPGFMKILSAPTGSGKFIRLLALAPTRELAKQIEDEARKFGGPCRINTACLYGGAPRGAQLGQLRRGAQVIMATPGRLNDFLDSGQVDLSHCDYVVLDEADRMLDMGFEPQIRTIIAKVASPRQTLMYTATWGREVRSLASDFLVDPFCVTLGQERLAANSDVQQSILVCQNDDEKLQELRKILQSCVQGDLVLIFCETKAGCAWLGEHLYTAYRIPCTTLHGDLDQSARDRAIQNFKSGRKPIMVGTDVAARGLDIKGIKVVINFDPAGDGEDYVHRIGRTGRAGETGYAYSLLTPKNAKKARDIVRVMQAGNIPIPPELASLAGMNSGCSKGKGKSKGGKGKRKGFGKGHGSKGT